MSTFNVDAQMAIGSFALIDLRIHQSGDWADARTLTIITLDIFHSHGILHSIAPDRSSLPSTDCTDIRLAPHRLKHTLLCPFHLTPKSNHDPRHPTPPKLCYPPRAAESHATENPGPASTEPPIEIPSFPRSPPKSQPWSNPAF